MNIKILCLLFFTVISICSAAQSVVITGNSVICQGQPTTLHAEVSGTGIGTTSYNFEYVDFATHPAFSGGTVIDPDFTGCTSAGHDDCWAGGTPPDHSGYDIGFTFCFFNQNYTKFYVGSNGWIGFTDPTDHSWTTYTATTIPNTDPNVPKNCIFAPWQDWYPGAGGTEDNVYYYTTGSAPSRKLVVYWINCPLFQCSGPGQPRGTFMIVLNEGSNTIENFLQSKPNCKNSNEGSTQGVHNIDGTIAFTATGRNYDVWEATDDGTLFAPSGIIWYKDTYPGGPIVGYGPDITVSPTTTTQYFAVVGTCDGGSAIGNITITVNLPPADPVINGPSTVCQDNINHYTTQSGMTAYDWTGTTGIITGGGTAADDFIDVQWNITGPQLVKVIYSSLQNCPAVNPGELNINVTTFDIPVITGVSEICPEVNATFTTQSGMSNYIWDYPGAGLVNGGGNTDDFITLKWTTSGLKTISVNFTNTSGCTGTLPGTHNVSVNPLPNVIPSVPPPLTICSGSNAQVTLSSAVPGTETNTTFVWTASGNAATITPDPSTISGSGDILQNLTNSGNSLEPVVFHIMPTAAGCSPASATDFIFNVNPVPVVQTSPGTQQVICSGIATQPIMLQTNVTGLSPTYGWNSVCDPGITDCPPGSGSSNPIASFTPVNPTLTQKTITYGIFASLPAASVSCSGPTAGYTILVNPRPNVTNTILSQEVCSGFPSISVSLQADINGTTFSWVSSATPGITGSTPGGTGDLPVQTLSNSTTSQGSVTYTITPSYSQDGVTCSGITKDYTILVDPLPQPTINGPVSICEGTTGITYTTETLMTGYTWTVSSGGTITSGAGTNTIIVTWNTAGLQTVAVNYTNGYGCTATSATVVNITVNATPILTVAGNNDLCAGSANVNYSTSAGMSTYSWAISPGGTPVGATNTNSVNVNWAINATPNQSVTVNYTNSLGCSNSTGYPVTIHPLPVSTFAGSTTVCQLYPDPYLYTADPGPACSYTWSIIPPSSGSIVNANVSPASITWNTPGTATLRLDAVTGSGCFSSSPQLIQINPAPEVSLTPCFDLVTCRSAKPFLLKGGTPLGSGGNYYIDGTFVASSILDPSTLSITNHILSYTYTNINGCPATDTKIITVRDFNPPCGTSMTDYRDGASYRTSLIGGKCWMMENLRYGSSLTPTTAAQTDNCIVEKYCLSTDPSCISYGGLYQWDELIQYGVTAPPEYQGVCPPGWHIPTAADYQALIDANQGNALAGYALTDLNLNPRGFEALLNGMFYLNTSWAFTSTAVPAGTLFWTSTPGSGNKIVTRGMNNKVPSVSLYETSKNNAFPVRCVKDQ